MARARFTLRQKESSWQFVFLLIGCVFLGESRCNVTLFGQKLQHPVAGNLGLLGGAFKEGSYRDCQICLLQRVYIFEGAVSLLPLPPFIAAPVLLPFYPFLRTREGQNQRERKREIVKEKHSPPHSSHCNLH